MSAELEHVSGLWFDGQSSRGQPLDLRVEGGRLWIMGAAGTSQAWPLKEVSISPRLGNVPRLLRRSGHGHIECTDAPLLSRWFAGKGSRIERIADYLERRKGAIVAAALATVALLVAGAHWGVP